jgi:hypothetical protein
MIGPRIMAEIKEQIGKLLDRYLSEIDQAYLSSEAGLKISLPVKIGPSDRPGFEAIEGISFVQKKVKQSITKYVSEAQDPLIKKIDTVLKDSKAFERLRPRKGSTIDSVTISHSVSGESVTLEQPK